MGKVLRRRKTNHQLIIFCENNKISIYPSRLVNNYSAGSNSPDLVILHQRISTHGIFLPHIILVQGRDGPYSARVISCHKHTPQLTNRHLLHIKQYAGYICARAEKRDRAGPCLQLKPTLSQPSAIITVNGTILARSSQVWCSSHCLMLIPLSGAHPIVWSSPDLASCYVLYVLVHIRTRLIYSLSRAVFASWNCDTLKLYALQG